MKPVEFISHSESDTFTVGRTISHSLRKGDIIALQGSLGAGKTVLVRGIVEGLGIMDLVQSPTFMIILEYNGPVTVYHMDLYRIQGEDDFLTTGGEELLGGDGICLIEWSERIKGMLPQETRVIDITIEHDLTRKIVYRRIS